MNRLIQTAAIALTLIVPVLARAETSLWVSYNPAALATPAGVAALKTDIVAKADVYCRANPVQHTVAECRQALVAEMSRDLDVRAVQYAQANSPVKMAQR
jgi:UrcA family protein